VAEITNRNTDRHIWLDIFQSAAHEAWRHDVENVRLRSINCGALNFLLGSEDPMPELFAPPHRGAAPSSRGWTARHENA
jgi:hypothetical protein